MSKHKQNNPGKPSWLRRLIGWGPLVLVVGLWVHSYFYEWLLGFDNPGDGRIALSSDNGALVMTYSTEGGFEGRGVSLGDESLFTATSNAAPHIVDPRVFPAFEVYEEWTTPNLFGVTGLPYTPKTTFIIVPYWLVSIATIVWLYSMLLRHYRRYPKGTIPCPKCDYDLRGSIGASTCPECGADVKGLLPTPAKN